MKKKLEFDVIIVGGGIVGLSVAYKFLLKNRNSRLLLIEKENSLAFHQTGHNSGVIHSGIYYKPNSLKAINCFEGYSQLINFCQSNNLKYNICGKIIAARNQSEIQQLEFLLQRGNQNGLEGLRYLTSKECYEKEPYLKVKKTLWVPQTGIVDYKQVALCISEKIKLMGGQILLNNEVKYVDDKGYLETGDYIAKADCIITCCGLQSDRMFQNKKRKENLKILPFRGEYFKLINNKSKLVNGLIYPVPDLNFPFLGVHFTNDLSGNVEIGPNAILALSREGYKNKFDFNFKDSLDTLTSSAFYKLIGKYYQYGFYEVRRSFVKNYLVKEVKSFIPQIENNDIVYERSGIRAQLCNNEGKLIDDFKILKNNKVIYVLNAPSPAATSSLSIADYINKLI